jgi:hypothetical protein
MKARRDQKTQYFAEKECTRLKETGALPVIENIKKRDFE